jgi:hypothetical protein
MRRKYVLSIYRNKLPVQQGAQALSVGQQYEPQHWFLVLIVHVFAGLLENLKGEKEQLEDGLHRLVQDRNVMDHDLETTRNRLQEFEESESEFKAKKNELERQKLALEETVPSEQKGEKGMKLYCHNCVLYSRFGWT